jgi:type II secretory pathway pseudopilin PulG
MKRLTVFLVFATVALPAFFFAATLAAQESQALDPAATLSAALSAACRGNEAQFATYLTAENSAAFRALPPEQRAAFLKRFSLSDEPAKPLISSDLQDHTILRCLALEGTAEFRFGDVRVHENLAFVPVTVVDGEHAEFGFVRESGAWRLLSLGLVLLDVPQLSKQWAAADLRAREESAVEALRDLAEAIGTYRRAWGKLPDSLAQLGPAPKNNISPDQASLVDDHLAGGSKGGYQFRYRITPGSKEDDPAFEIAATPNDYGKTGRRSFFFDSAGKTHGADKHGAMVTAEDPLVTDEKTP